MNTRPPDEETPDEETPEEIDELYRRTAALDPSRPSESARRSIMDHAARVAAERAAHRDPTDIRTARRASKRTRRAAVFGTLAAAILAGLVVIPRFWSPPAPPRDLLTTTAVLPAAPAPNQQNAVEPPAALDELQAPPAAAAPHAVAPPRFSEAPSAGRLARNAPAPRSAAAPGVSEQRAQDAAAAEASVGLANVTVTARKAAASPPSPQSPQPAQSAQPAQTAQSAQSAQLAQAEAPAKFAQSSLQGLSAAFQARQRVDPGAALRRAAQAGDILALNQALGQPVDINARDDSGRTALMLAVRNGQGSAVDALLAHGADPNVADAMGKTPLETALERADASIVSALRRAGARENE